MKENIVYIATCLFGLERYVGEEIDALGYRRLETADGRVTFEGDIHAIARCNIWLRTAERVYIKMGEFEALSFDDLFEGTKALPWERWIGCDDMFPVKGHAIKSALYSIPDCQSIIKKAVVERLKSEYAADWFKEEGAKYQIEFFILKNRTVLMIDTSGAPLHKRGYRPEAGLAPLRETLAAAMVKIARPRENVLLWDPFAGSGTIPLEAALIMTNTAPGINRSFVSEDFYDIPADSFENAREEARAAVKTDSDFEAYASDIDHNMVETAAANIKRAGMEKYVKLFRMNALDIESKDRRGTIVCNPPYGERLLDKEKAAELYVSMGKAFAGLDRWQIYVISSEENFQRLYGRRANNIRKLYNGMIKCFYYQYFKD
ncbi:MAG: class I SAM-dependent RNA methyltransferase [Eubacteriales bacterium]|jgi:putative N6-adenine-specific DNA methylase|nr:class I SAM-dependent RNA methyltransferase [Eubacteriales bacterium]